MKNLINLNYVIINRGTYAIFEWAFIQGFGGEFFMVSLDVIWYVSKYYASKSLFYNARWYL